MEPDMPEGKPNILVIWGDDIGQSNLSCYTHGLMGYRRPNIDRIAKEGMLFTDSYGEQSCTAGRSSFITGQSVTGQFGKNHLGDLKHMLPTNHGFDEFYGNLYHLNAEEEPEMDNYPTEAELPNFKKNFGPRGVMHSFATDVDDPTDEPRWGRVGKQKIEDTGPLTTKRMETCDDDFVATATRFIKKANSDGRGGEVRGDLRGLPTGPARQQLHHRRRHGEDVGGDRRRELTARSDDGRRRE
jgi:arylsulfatase A-like enzyme